MATPLTLKVKVKETEYEIDTKDALMIITLQELINKIGRLSAILNR